MPRAPHSAPALAISLGSVAFALSVSAGIAVARDLPIPAAVLTLGAASVAMAAKKSMSYGYPGLFVPIAAAWGEAALFAGAAWHFGDSNGHTPAMAAFAALTAALAQFYTAARAEVVGAPASEGPVRYPVRTGVLAAALAFDQLELAIWPLAVLAMASALLTFTRLLRSLRAQPGQAALPAPREQEGSAPG